MNRLGEEYITSGEFAKMSGVNKQTLLFYDKIRLFTPAFVDGQGYRYYTVSQMDNFFTILALKTIGMSLDEIKNYIDARTPETTLDLFQKYREKARVKIREMEILSREMKKRCELIEKAKEVSCGEIYIEHHEKQFIQSGSYIPENATAMERYTSMKEVIKYRLENQLHCGHAIGGMVEKAFFENPAGDKTKYCRYFTVIDNPEDDKGNMEKPAGNYLVLYYRGSYNTTYLTYSQILQYAEKHNMKLGDYMYEESLIDEISERNSQNYITQIMIPFSFYAS